MESEEWRVELGVRREELGAEGCRETDCRVGLTVFGRLATTYDDRPTGMSLREAGDAGACDVAIRSPA